MIEERDDTEGGDLLSGMIVTLVVHAALGTAFLAFLWLIVPRFAEIYADFGVKLPDPTQLVVNLSFLVRSNPGLVFLASVFALVLDGIIYVLANVFFGPSMSRSWAWFVGVLWILLLIGSFCTLWLPIMTGHQVVAM